MAHKTSVKVTIQKNPNHTSYQDPIFTTTVETERGTPSEIHNILKATYPNMRQYHIGKSEKIESPRALGLGWRPSEPSQTNENGGLSGIAVLLFLALMAFVAHLIFGSPDQASHNQNAQDSQTLMEELRRRADEETQQQERRLQESNERLTQQEEESHSEAAIARQRQNRIDEQKQRDEMMKMAKKKWNEETQNLDRAIEEETKKARKRFQERSRLQ